jgi:hypothetical protein
MTDEELKLEEIEASHTLGGYRRCRCYSALGHDVLRHPKDVFKTSSQLRVVS